jgi:hypothetical protein
VAWLQLLTPDWTHSMHFRMWNAWRLMSPCLLKCAHLAPEYPRKKCRPGSGVPLAPNTMCYSNVLLQQHFKCPYCSWHPSQLVALWTKAPGTFFTFGIRPHLRCCSGATPSVHTLCLYGAGTKCLAYWVAHPRIHTCRDPQTLDDSHY